MKGNGRYLFEDFIPTFR